MSTSGPITGFPCAGLSNAQRFITGHNEKGEAVFLVEDHGDHHSIMAAGAGVQNILYQTSGDPVEMTDNVDIEFAKTNPPPLYIPGGSMVRMIDFAPGVESNMHRAICLGYGTVCEGEVEFSLDSGEARIMRPGDVSVNRGAMHKWRNVSKDKPARMLWVLIDCKPVIVNGKALEFDMGILAKEYHDGEAKK